MTDSDTKPSFLARPGKPDIAYRRREGGRPGLFWLGGYASDMNGNKARHLDRLAREQVRAFIRFDYAGHGESGGEFEDGGIGDWARDALAVLDTLSDGPQVLIGSSMGAWIACLLARWRPERLAAMVLLAPAADFTSELRWPAFDEAMRETVMREGRIEIASPFDDGVTVYTRRLFEDGEHHLVLRQPLNIAVPVRILQGMADDVVPWRHAVRLAEHIAGPDIRLTLIKSGDHRLSTPHDLALLGEVLDAL